MAFSHALFFFLFNVLVEAARRPAGCFEMIGGICSGRAEKEPQPVNHLIIVEDTWEDEFKKRGFLPRLEALFGTVHLERYPMANIDDVDIPCEDQLPGVEKYVADKRLEKPFRLVSFGSHGSQVLGCSEHIGYYLGAESVSTFDLPLSHTGYWEAEDNEDPYELFKNVLKCVAKKAVQQYEPLTSTHFFFNYCSHISRRGTAKEKEKAYPCLRNDKSKRFCGPKDAKASERATKK
eukprot:TRINITY_DN67175_c0_g1_i1.p1 TRINITY_DN67175_c0_g1~~TRINITY_DN67175_c0_g1_i1.p1  ORF type:complete len:251 (+),score=34.73 TRINITY_DN67175_c0_g1_i1:49-753(+)